jgi:hypothetical protein
VLGSIFARAARQLALVLSAMRLAFGGHLEKK